MMNITRVYGSNFCQYKKFSHTLVDGLTCIRGMNGTGKSNCVRAIYLCLRGEVYGPSNLVRDGHPKGFVAFDARTSKGTFTVTRDLTHNAKTGGTKIKHSLEASWLDDPLTKKAEVTTFMETFIGKSPAVLEHITFALQGEFDSLMKMDHMPRARILNSLMGLDRAENLRSVLKDGLDMIADMPDRTDDIALLEANLKETELTLIQYQGKRDAAQDQITDQVIAAYKQALTMKERITSTARDNTLAQVRQQLTGDEEAVKAAKHVSDELAAKATQVEPPDHAGSAQHRDYLQCRAAIEKLNADLKHAGTQLPEKPEQSAYDLCSDDARQKLTESHAEVISLHAKITSFGTGICPTCNQELKVDFDIEAVKSEYEEKNAAYATAQQAYSDTDAKIAEYDRKLHHSNTEINRLSSELTANNNRMETLKVAETFDVEAYTQACTDYNNALQIQQEYTAAMTTLSGAENAVTITKNRIQLLEQEPVVTPEQLQWAETMISSYDTLKQQVDEATAQIQSIEGALSGKRSQLEMMQADMEKAGTNKTQSDLLEFSRARLHPEQLPRLAAQNSIRVINRKMEKYLTMFSFPYPFRLDENCDFVIDYEYTKGVPCAVLSGGERVRAAMVMRFALNEVFGSGLGILIVDEPTTALDVDARAALVDVLTQAAAHFRNTHTKLVCPTHEQQLEITADHVINLGEQV